MVDLRQSYRALRGRGDSPAAEHPAATAAGPAVEVPVLVTEPDPMRLITEHDIPWLVYLCKKKYSNRYDAPTTENWFRNIVLKSPMTFYATRSDNAFQITMLSVMPWLPAEPEANMIFVCADTGKMWEALRLLRDSVDWARNRKCAIWRLSSDTEIDFPGVARRLGCDEISPRYLIRF